MWASAGPCEGVEPIIAERTMLAGKERDTYKQRPDMVEDGTREKGGHRKWTARRAPKVEEEGAGNGRGRWHRKWKRTKRAPGMDGEEDTEGGGGQGGHLKCGRTRRTGPEVEEEGTGS
jgi:hypothetical protein